jgi:hypothetical protein
MVVLAVPAQAADTADATASYSVSLHVESVFPAGAGWDAAFLGDAAACREGATAAAAALSAAAAAAGPGGAPAPNTAARAATAEVPYGETLLLFYAVRSREPRRAILTLRSEAALLTPAPPPAGVPDADGGRLELYHRRCMVGDAALGRGRLFEARLAYDAAVAVDPAAAAAHLRLLRLAAAAGGGDAAAGGWGGGGGGPAGGAEAAAAALRERALFGAAREAAEAAGKLMEPAESGRASAIRAARDAGMQRLADVRRRPRAPRAAHPRTAV